MTQSAPHHTITLTLPSPDWEICEALLNDHCVAVSAFMTPKNASLWTLVGILEKDASTAFRSSFIQEAEEKGVFLTSEDLVIAPLEETNWLHQLSLDFPAFCVENFWIHGTHITELPPPHHIELIINAATAFGSGEHETTKGCLILLKKLLDEEKIPMPSPQVLDMGTGSGILLIALAKSLGQKDSFASRSFDPFLLGVDSDPDAVTVSQENAAYNQVSSLMCFKQSTGFDTLGPMLEAFDLIFANIVLGPLRLLREDFSVSLKPKGYLILSGLLQTQVPELLQYYLPHGFHLIESQPLGEWCSLLLQKIQ